MAAGHPLLACRRKREVARLIVDADGLESYVIASRLGTSLRVVNDAARELERAGLVSRIGSSRYGTLNPTPLLLDALGAQPAGVA